MKITDSEGKVLFDLVATSVEVRPVFNLDNTKMLGNEVRIIGFEVCPPAEQEGGWRDRPPML